MKRVTAALIAVVVLAGCGAHFVDIGFAHPVLTDKKPASITMPKLRDIATPDRAELALYAAAKVYEAAVATINQLHKEGKIAPARYAELVGNPDSYARRLSAAGLAADAAILIWRQQGKREDFNAKYSELGTLLVQLAKETR